jgi:diguanylate cyclase (GGDEF)-like protein
VLRIRWIYLIAAVPWLTEGLERGHLPGSPRELITEICLSFLLLGLAWRVCRQQERLQAMAERDGLTGLLNARRFHEDLRQEIGRARRLRIPLSLALLDLDGLKSINDRYGHPEGDVVLGRAARVLLESVRLQQDRCYRIGGDEFAILLSKSGIGEADQVLERIRARAAQPALHDTGLSAGVVELRPHEEAGGFFKRADVLLYAAKSRGKNQVLSQDRDCLGTSRMSVC